MLLDIEMTFELDVPSLDALVEPSEGLAEEDVDLMLVRVHQDVRDILDQSGVVDTIGADRIHRYTIDGMLGFLALSSQAEKAVKAHLFESVQAFEAEAAALLEQATGSYDTELAEDRLLISSDIARYVQLLSPSFSQQGGQFSHQHW